MRFILLLLKIILHFRFPRTKYKLFKYFDIEILLNLNSFLISSKDLSKNNKTSLLISLICKDNLYKYLSPTINYFFIL